jgi:hypothetical protein
MARDLLLWMHTLTGWKIKCADLFEQMPKLCQNLRYSKEFTKTIFQKLQAKEAKGDGKRKQAEMTKLLKLAAFRSKEAGDIANRKVRNKSQPVKKTKSGVKIK